MNVYTALTEMDAIERAMLLQCGMMLSYEFGKMNLEGMTLRGELCPARLSERIYGHERVCEAEKRSRGTCKSCTRQFLLSQWPEDKETAHETE